MENVAFAVLFCKESVEIDDEAVSSWFEAEQAIRIAPLKEQLDTLEFINGLADALFFSDYDVEDAIVIINAKESGFLFAKNSGIFDYYFFVDSEIKIEKIKKWANAKKDLR